METALTVGVGGLPILRPSSSPQDWSLMEWPETEEAVEGEVTADRSDTELRSSIRMDCLTTIPEFDVAEVRQEEEESEVSAARSMTSTGRTVSKVWEEQKASASLSVKPLKISIVKSLRPTFLGYRMQVLVLKSSLTPTMTVFLKSRISFVR